MSQVNSRAPYVFPNLFAAFIESRDPHILTLAPPINLDPSGGRPYRLNTLAKNGNELVNARSGRRNSR